MRRVLAWWRVRWGRAGRDAAALEDEARAAFGLGKVLVVLLVMQAVTGAALAAFYSPSTSDAWASVAYLQDQTSWGWLVRGLHHHGGSALVVIAGVHLVQTAIAGAYRRPRELVWWLGLILLVLIVVSALTGFVLRWDQAAFWAQRVELGIVASAPVVGERARELIVGGNDQGNLTLTRTYASHVVLLPAITTLVCVAHIAVARRHGLARVRPAPLAAWPRALRDACVSALVIGIVLSYVVRQHGVALMAPADPAHSFDARPLWYLRWLFELREVFGSAETLVALTVPAVLGGFFVALPLIDAQPTRALRQRMIWLGALAGVIALIAGLIVRSLWRDASDPELAERLAKADRVAARARELARTYGVPASGAREIWSMAPMARARQLFAKHCHACHVDPEERTGPLITAGHGNRAWLTALLKDPDNDLFYGRTDLVKNAIAARAREASGSGSGSAGGASEQPQDLAMPATTLSGPDLEAVVELMYAQSGSSEVDRTKLARGTELFTEHCDSCHSLSEGEPGAAGPSLAGRGSRAYYLSFIGNPRSALHMKDLGQMPRFDEELSVSDRDALAAYLVWLSTATPNDQRALGPVDPYLEETDQPVRALP